MSARLVTSCLVWDWVVGRHQPGARYFLPLGIDCTLCAEGQGVVCAHSNQCTMTHVRSDRFRSFFSYIVLSPGLLSARTHVPRPTYVLRATCSGFGKFAVRASEHCSLYVPQGPARPSRGARAAGARATAPTRFFSDSRETRSRRASPGAPLTQ